MGRYGSKLLYTNTDLSGSVSATTPLKVGGQEFGVASATSYVITLNEPFLGTSIIPVLTDTGSKATALKTNALEMVTSAGGKITALTVGDSAAVSAQGYCTTRGSADIYSCAQTGSGVV